MCYNPPSPATPLLVEQQVVVIAKLVKRYHRCLPNSRYRFDSDISHCVLGVLVARNFVTVKELGSIPTGHLGELDEKSTDRIS